MTLKTNLNSAPYYDDFDSSDNFHRVLFRPGYAIQARELTQLQSILQDQIEKHGNHVFKDGSIVVPGQVNFNNAYQSVRLSSTFNGESINPAQFYNPDDLVLITGETSGVTAEVIGYAAAGDAATQPLLYVKYISSGTSENAALDEATSSIFFENGENISADITTTHTTTYAAGSNSLSVFFPSDPNDDACAFGSAVTVNSGVFYVKGTFVELSAPQTLVLSYNNGFPNNKVGFTVTEEIVTPEADTTLLDNATGTSNYAAKGAHRLKINLTLSKKTLDDSTSDDDFVELIRIIDGKVITKAKETEYSLLGNALAQRTYEESGDYVIKPYKFNITESVDNFVGSDLFLGAYENGVRTDDYTLAQDDFLAVHIQPGTAYVNGHRAENIGTIRKDLLKARDTKSIENGITNFEIGNYLRLTNIYGSPDIGDVSDETTPYRPLLLWDTTNTSRGSAAGNAVGVLRSRAFQHESNGSTGAGASSSNTDGIYRLYAYDVRAFVRLELNDTPSPTVISNFSTGGVQVTGVTSGATGFVFNDTTNFPDTTLTSTKYIYLTNVIGAFEEGEKLKTSDSIETSAILENSANQDLTINDIVVNKLSDARQVQMQEADTGQDFTADIVLENLDPADNSFFADQTTSDEGVVKIQLEEGTAEGINKLQLETLKGARFRDPELQQSIFKMPKKVIKTLLTEDNNATSQTELTFRKQFVGTTSSAGVVSFQAQANETFVDFAESDYTVSILTAGGGTGSQGDLVSISGKTAGHNTATLTITDSTILGSAAKVKVIATIKKTNVVQSTKTANLSKQLKVVQQGENAAGAYGARAQDKEISLGRTDVYRIQAIYDSQTNSTDAVAPTLTVSSIEGTFERGERIKGNTTGARGRLITTSSPLNFTQTFGEGSTQFEAGETVTGEFSGATAVIDLDGITTGDLIITDNFKFDDGQRNNYYDISRLVRKEGVSAPTGRLLIIYDYFSHSSGFFFSVDSYSTVAGQMQYDDIPLFIPTTVDPDDPAPASEFPLADCLDFRPTVENIAGTSETLTTVDQVTGNSFDFFSRQYDGTGAIVVDTPKPDSTITSDFEFYLPKIICLYLLTDGQFQVLESEPNEQPTYPAPIDNAMKIADFYLPAYTFRPYDVDIEIVDNSRYTMRDIGKLETRIDNLEYYSSLNLLESQTNSLEVLDTNGLNRFKSGFVVDPFTGHNVGDERNPDYHVAIDADEREMRPRTVDKSLDLKLLLTNTSEQTAAGFQKTGNLITLPYTQQTVLNNAYQVVKPVVTIIDSPEDELLYRSEDFELSPDEDSWFETEVQYLPTVTSTTLYEAELASFGGSTTTRVWGSWRDSGAPYGRGTITGAVTGQLNRKKSGSYDRWLYSYPYKQNQIRTQTVKTLTSYWDTKYGDPSFLGTDTIKFCRPKAIKFKGMGFKPNTRHYVYFDGKNVDRFSGPLAQQYAVQTSGIRAFASTSYADVDFGDSVAITPARPGPNMGIPIKSNNIGKLEGFFLIPDTRGKNKGDVPQFPTGELDLIVMTNSKNEKGLVFSMGQDTYTASGQKQKYQRTVVATKKPKYVTSTNNQTQTISVNKYLFGGPKHKGLQPSRKWQYYFESKTDSFVRDQVAAWIRKGVLEKEGNRIRVTDAYAVKSPGEWSRSDVAPQIGLTVVSLGSLYQTFHVDKEGGYFATSLTMYFQKKAKNDPVSISIVTTEDGVPTEFQLPYSSVTLATDEVNADMGGETATTFTFPSPVYLKGGEKYAIKVKSKGDTYKVKIGRESIGETKNPALGEVYLPTTDFIHAYSEVGIDNYHMRFNMQGAIFNDIAEGGTCTLRNAFAGELMTKENGGFAYAKRLVTLNPLEASNSITKIKVNHFDHGMYNTSNNVQISGVKSGVTTTLNGSISDIATKLVLKSFAGFSSGSTHAGSGAIFVKIDNELFTGTLSGSTLTVSSRGTDIDTTSAASTSHADGATVELYMLLGTPLNQINKIHTSISDIQMDSYCITVSTAPTVTGSVSTVSAGGSDVFASENYRYELFKTYVPTLELPGTAIGAKVRQTTGTSPGGSETSFTTTTEAKAFPIALNQEYALEKTAIIASPPNETNEMDSNRSFFLDLTLKSNNAFLSPVIDLTDPSLICIANRLDNVDSSSDVYTPNIAGIDTNYRASTEPVGDNNTAIYLTKPAQLENTATGIKLFLDVHKPPTSEVKAMFRILPSEGEDDIKSIPFTFFNSTGLPDSGVATNAQAYDDFVEYKYTAGINDFGAGEELQDFQQFQIKIVMQGTNAAKPPRIMNLRGIALAT